MLNTWTGIGRIGQDLELKSTQNGAKYINFNLAVTRPKSQNQQEPDTDWVPCTAWNKTAEIMSEHLHKGSLIAVEGPVRVRSYEDDAGNKRKAVSINVFQFHFLEKKQDGQQSQSQSPASFDSLDFNDDDIPF